MFLNTLNTDQRRVLIAALTNWDRVSPKRAAQGIALRDALLDNRDNPFGRPLSEREIKVVKAALENVPEDCPAGSAADEVYLKLFF